MEEEKILKYLEEIERYFPTIFYDSDKMKKHLFFIQLFPEYEWFNIVSIFMCNPDASYVQSLHDWTQSCGSEVLPKMGEKSIPMLVMKGIHENRMKWEMVKGYDIGQFEKEDVIGANIRDSPLKKMIRKTGKEKVKNYFLNNPDWCRKYVQYAFKQKGFKEESEIKNYIENCCLYILSNFIEIEKEKKEIEDLKFPTDLNILTKDYIRIFREIKEMIISLPQIWIEINEKQERQEEKYQEEQMLLYLKNQSIKEWIKKALEVLEKRKLLESTRKER